MAITLTQAAASRVKQFLDNRGKGVGLRLGVKTTGCSGMAYVISMPTRSRTTMWYSRPGRQGHRESKSLAYLDGNELDYAKEGLNEGFRFNNPNVKDTCGCGESFNV
jgi:iron-sulfur cluster assembly protein